jgi:hypothetical protein
MLQLPFASNILHKLRDSNFIEVFDWPISSWLFQNLEF